MAINQNLTLPFTAYTNEMVVLNPTADSATAYWNFNGTGAYFNGVLVNFGTDSFAAAVTAYASGGQTNATPLTAYNNIITTCANNYGSVLLPVPTVIGQIYTVDNATSHIASVFPSTGNTINGLAVNLSVDIPAGAYQQFTANTLTSWSTPTVLFAPSATTQTGDLVIKATASAGNYQTLITNASQAAARTYTIPDAGANANFTMSTGVGSVQASVGSATTVTSSTTLVAVTGLTANLLAGATYAFHVHIPCTANGSGGTQAAMGGTATWTSINTTVQNNTASAISVTTGTTATPGTAIAGSTAANIQIIIEGTVVCNAAGTLIAMFAQNASNGTGSVALANSYMTVTRIA